MIKSIGNFKGVYSGSGSLLKSNRSHYKLTLLDHIHIASHVANCKVKVDWASKTSIYIYICNFITVYIVNRCQLYISRLMIVSHKATEEEEAAMRNE